MNEICRACSRYGEEERCIRVFVKDPGIDERIVLIIWIFRNGLICLRIGGLL